MSTIKIQVKTKADSSAVSLLKKAVYGTTGIRYRQTGQVQKISKLINPLFFHLYDSEGLQGLYCLDHRLVSCPWGEVNAFYGRYLAVAESSQGKGYGRQLKTEAVRHIEKEITSSYILYSYIEENNTRSLKISLHEGFKSIAQLKTFVFRRLRPVPDQRVNQLLDQDYPTVINLLKSHYHSHSLRTFAKIGENDNYFTLKEGNELIGGLQANPVAWQILKMPGIKGWFLMNVLPFLPGLRKLFSPAYQFLALEGAFIKPGYEHLFPILLQSVLAHCKLNSALYQIDTKDIRLNSLMANLGILSGFEAITTHVLVKAHGLTNDQMTLLQENPIYCSSFDFT